MDQNLDDDFSESGVNEYIPKDYKGEKCNQLHYGASNEIKEIEVFKKCPKVNPYCNAIFDPIIFKPFLDGAK